jgi:Cytochrome c7 and related cytochrome c
MNLRNVLLFLGALFLFSPAFALANVSELVMPGPVIEGHANIEGTCTRCHDLLSHEQQRALCLDCHNPVAADIEGKLGFHGKNPAVDKAECRTCHTDHKGRNSDILLLDVETFDHRLTDFELKGAHQKVECIRCHNPALLKSELFNRPEQDKPVVDKYRNAPVQCVDCHQQVEPHKGALGKRCQDCHQPEHWDKYRFDHKQTDFQLEGAHQQVSCNLCHPNQRWKEVPTNCYACHRLNDNHAGRFGEKCESCHSPRGSELDRKGEKQSAWAEVAFDHSKTDFPLHDKHRKVQCVSCHTGQIGVEKPPKDCISCHQTEDPHRGRFGQQCQKCHQTTGWEKAEFNHDKTDFPLTDQHAKVTCSTCHTGPSDGKKLSLNCYSCHQLDDAHSGQQGQDCASCHSPRGWREEVQFEHGLSRFPLIGMHAVAPCEACHQDTSFKDVERDCISCHKDDDDHQQRLGSECASCHNPNGWDLWQFEHNIKSSFQFDGKHEALACLACHDEPVKGKINIGESCANCHSKDDPHSGNFGRNCERCHSTEGFDKLMLEQ